MVDGKTQALNLQIEVPLFPLALFAIGLIWLIRRVTQGARRQAAHGH